MTPLDCNSKVIIVGASLAGLRTAEELRRRGFDGGITLVGDEGRLPYDRPPLSKKFLSGNCNIDDLRYRNLDELSEFDITMVLGATAIGFQDDKLFLEGGSVLSFTHLVIATGARARKLPGQQDSPRVHHLRTVDDAVRLRDSMATSQSLTLIGGGFIGAEVASVARSKGIDVTMIEASEQPFARVLGEHFAARCARLHTDNGVQLFTGRFIESLKADESSVRLVLDDGEELESDIVLVGVGAIPNTDWLNGTGLNLVNGVACDAGGRAVTHHNIYAVGDVAAWHSDFYGERQRVEHWTNATEQAHILSHTMTGTPINRRTQMLPYFWSDQYGVKLQLYGRPDLSDSIEVIDLPKSPRVAALYFAHERLVAVAVLGAPGILARLRPLVVERAEASQAMAKLMQLAAAAA